MRQRLRTKSHESILKALLIYSILTLCLWVTGLNDFQYRTVNEVVLSGGFPGEIESWQIRGPVKNVQIKSDAVEFNRAVNGYTSVHKDIVLPEQNIHDLGFRVLVSGRTLSENADLHRPFIESSDKDSEHATAPGLLVLQMFDAGGQRLRAAWIGAIPAKLTEFKFERVLTLPPETSEVALGLLFRNSQTNFSVESVAMSQVRKSGVYLVVVATLFVVTLSFSFRCLISIARFLDYKIIFATLALLTLMVVLLTVPVKTQLGFIYSLIGSSPPVISPSIMLWLSTLSHILIFLVLGLFFVSRCNSAGIPLVYPMAYLVLMTLASEVLQLHFHQRSMNFHDVGFDCLGIILASILCHVISVRYRNKPGTQSI